MTFSPVFIFQSVPAKAILLLYYSQTLRKEVYLEPSLMYVMHLIDMYNVVCSPFSNHFVFYKAIWRGCESVWFKVYTSDTCWQPRWLNSQWKCQPGLSGEWKNFWCTHGKFKYEDGPFSVRNTLFNKKISVCLLYSSCR